MVRVFVAVSLVLACSPLEANPPGTTPAAIPPITSPSVALDKPPPEPFGGGDEVSVRLALKQAGVETDDHDCFAWPTSFPRVVVYGSFAHDRGCDVEGVFVDRSWHATGGEIPGLATRGYADARLAAKEAIARAWADEVIHAFGGSFVTEPEPAFTFPDSPNFFPVFNRLNKQGGVVVEGWTSVPPGMVDESAYTLMSYHFAPDGALTVESKQRFAVAGDRLRAPDPPAPQH